MKRWINIYETSLKFVKFYEYPSLYHKYFIQKTTKKTLLLFFSAWYNYSGLNMAFTKNLQFIWEEKMESFQDYLELAFAFMGGFGLFIYGMHTMANGLQKSAGNKMKELLGVLTNNRFLGVIVGALVTAIIQSSSATTVMVVGFVNAGIMNLAQAVGVIMGANIGTTITAWIVSSAEWMKFFKPSQIAPLAIAIGVMMMFFAKNKKTQQIGEIVAGFGILFIGLDFMKEAIEPYEESPFFRQAFLELGKNPILGILAGAAVTAIIQSSSASVGILQTLATLSLVPYNAAIYIILGQNIGTCVTAMLSSVGATRMAKRAANIHLIFNIMGTVFFAILVIVYFKFINISLGKELIDMTHISIIHTAFNISNTVVLFPFAGFLVSLSEKLIPEKDEEVIDEGQDLLRHLDDRILETPSFAVQSAIKEVIHMGELAKENTLLSKEAFFERNERKIERILTQEKSINALEKSITKYLVKISNLDLNESQNKVVSGLFHMVNDIERVGDHAENLAELAQYYMENNLQFTATAQQELEMIFKHGIDSFDLALQCRIHYDQKLFRKVAQSEDIVDKMEEELREKHIQRLAQNICDTTCGVVFLDIISNLERISDHAFNIAQGVNDEYKMK